MSEPFVIDINALRGKKRPIKNTIKANDNTDLAYAAYTSDEPQGCLIFFHGSGAHGMAGYTLMAEQLCNRYKINTYLFDIRGHGNSSGARGHTPNKEQVWEDITSAILFLKRQYINIPIYLGGHSAGAGLILNYSSWSKRLDVDAYVMIAPEFGHFVPLKHNKNCFARISLSPILMNKIFKGNIFGDALAIKFNYSESVVKRGGLVPGYTVNMYCAMTPENPIDSMVRIDTPTYILISEKDELFDSRKLIGFLDPIIQKNARINLQVSSSGGHLLIMKDAHNNIGDFINRLTMPRINEPELALSGF